jgi:hypothetical protein
VSILRELTTKLLGVRCILEVGSDAIIGGVVVFITNRFRVQDSGFAIQSPELILYLRSNLHLKNLSPQSSTLIVCFFS